MRLKRSGSKLGKVPCYIQWRYSRHQPIDGSHPSMLRLFDEWWGVLSRRYRVASVFSIIFPSPLRIEEFGYFTLSSVCARFETDPLSTSIAWRVKHQRRNDGHIPDKWRLSRRNVAIRSHTPLPNRGATLFLRRIRQPTNTI